MNKKVKIDIISFFMWLLLLLQVKFFWLIPSEKFYLINGNQQQVLMVLVLLVILFLLKGTPLSYGAESTKFYLLFFFCYYFFELIYSVIRNKQGILNVFVASNFYLFLLFYFFVIFFLYSRGEKNFYHIVIVISTINVIICWLQYFASKFGIFFTKLDTSSLRFGTIRIGALSETVTSLGLIICFSYFLENKKNKWGYFIVFFIGFLGNVIVSKGRISLLALFLACLAYLISKYKKYLLRIIIALLLSFVIVFSFASSSLGMKYFYSFSNSETDTASIRSRELTYYNNQTIKSPIIGVGFIRDNGDNASNYLKGPTHQYSRTDIGIWGLANTMGIISVIWYVMLTINLLRKIICIRKREVNYNLRIATAYMMYSIICIPTMIFLNPFSITSEAILMAIIDYIFLERNQGNYNV